MQSIRTRPNSDAADNTTGQVCRSRVDQMACAISRRCARHAGRRHTYSINQLAERLGWSVADTRTMLQDKKTMRLVRKVIARDMYSVKIIRDGDSITVDGDITRGGTSC